MNEEQKIVRDDLEDILARTGKQVSISTVGPMRAVLIQALTTFDDTTKASEAFTRALTNWGYNQRKDSKRGSLQRLEDSNAKLLENDQTILAKLEIIERMVREEIAEVQGRIARS